MRLGIFGLIGATFMLAAIVETAPPPPRYAQNLEEIYSAAAVLWRSGADGAYPACSAVAIERKGRTVTFLTAAHCLGEKKDGNYSYDKPLNEPIALSVDDTLDFDGNPLYPIPAIVLHKWNVRHGFDFALVTIVTDQDFPLVRLGTMHGVKIGDAVATVGSPVGLGKLLLFGNVSRLAMRDPHKDGGADWNGYLITSIMSQKGLSGAPVIHLGQMALIGVSAGSRGLFYSTAAPISLFRTTAPEAPQTPTASRSPTPTAPDPLVIPFGSSRFPY